MPSLTRRSSALNSSPRWLTIWRPPASRTDGGRPVGPGMRRFGSKRLTSLLLIARVVRSMVGEVTARVHRGRYVVI